jgi:membrane protein YqaA with SNARE-associated domain
MLAAIISTFSLAFFYFIAAIPAGAALQLPVWLAALTAGISYTAGVVVIVLIGAPLRERLAKRFNVSTTHDSQKLIWRVWDRYGLIGLSLLAPITLGAQIGALLGLSLGVKPRPLVIGMALGISVWCAAIGTAVALGLQVVRPA